MARKRPRKANPNFRPKSVGDYSNGYGKPPAATRFKPGECPNPKGRPKGAKNKPPPVEDVLKMIDEEAMRMLEHKEGNRIKKNPTARFIVRKINHSAANGSIPAQKLAMGLIMKAQGARRCKQDKLFTAAVECKRQWREDSRQRKIDGVPNPHVFPHPDDIQLDYETGEVTFVGLTADQEKLVSLLVDAKQHYESEINVCLTEDLNSEYPAQAYSQLVFLLHCLQKICKALDIAWATDFKTEPNFKNILALQKKVMNDLKERSSNQ